MNETYPVHKRAYLVAFIAAIAGLLFGLDLGIISGALPFLKKSMHLSTIQEGWVASSVLFGAAGGAIISIYTSLKFGRRNSLITAAFIFCLASIASAMSSDFNYLIISRVFLGISVGIATYNAPIYISEISPSHIRGKLITFYQLMITVGILVAFAIDLSFTASGNWRAMLGVIAIPGFIMFILLFLLPKSPRWLVLKGKVDLAKESLSKILHLSEVDSEIQAIYDGVHSHSQNIFKLLSQKPYIKVLLIAMVLQIMQQFSGMNAILYFAPEIFAHAGFSGHTGQMWATLGVGFINMIVTLFAIRLIESLGRRTLLLVSGSLIFVSTLALVFLFLSFDSNNQFASYLSLVAVFVFIIGYALGFAPVVWVLCAEIFPLNGKAFGMCVATTANWVSSGIVGIITLPLIRDLGIGNFYLFLMIFSIISLLFILKFIPETKGVSLETISKNLWANKPLRKIGK